MTAGVRSWPAHGPVSRDVSLAEMPGTTRTRGSESDVPPKVTGLSDEVLLQLGGMVRDALAEYEECHQVLSEEFVPIKAEILRRGLWWQLPPMSKRTTSHHFCD